MNDFTNRNKLSNPNDRVFIWYRAVRISEGVLYSIKRMILCGTHSIYSYMSRID